MFLPRTRMSRCTSVPLRATTHPVRRFAFPRWKVRQPQSHLLCIKKPRQTPCDQGQAGRRNSPFELLGCPGRTAEPYNPKSTSQRAADRAKSADSGGTRDSVVDLPRRAKRCRCETLPTPGRKCADFFWILFLGWVNSEGGFENPPKIHHSPDFGFCRVKNPWENGSPSHARIAPDRDPR